MNKFNLTAVMCHFVGDPIFPGLKTLPLADFKARLRHLETNYHMISWNDLSDFILRKRPLPPDSCVLTFDDGTKDHFDIVLPELHFRKIPAIFFVMGRQPGDGVAMVHKVQILTAKLGEAEFQSAFFEMCSDATRDLFLKKEKECLVEFPTSKHDSLKFRTFKRVIGRYMFDEAKPYLETLFLEQIGQEKEWGEKLYLSDSDLVKMREKGFHIGGHGVNHRWMSSLGAEEQKKEVEASASRLQKLGDGPWAFSYPYGDYSGSLPEILQKNNFISAFTIKEKTEHDDFFAIGRFDTNSIKKEKIYCHCVRTSFSHFKRIGRSLY